MAWCNFREARHLPGAGTCDFAGCSHDTNARQVTSKIGLWPRWNKRKPQSKNSAVGYTTLPLADHIATITLNRPDKANAMNLAMWREIRQAFKWVDATPEARVAILEGEVRLFTSGIDLQMMIGLSVSASRKSTLA